MVINVSSHRPEQLFSRGGRIWTRYRANIGIDSGGSLIETKSKSNNNIKYAKVPSDFLQTRTYTK